MKKLLALFLSVLMLLSIIPFGAGAVEIDQVSSSNAHDVLKAAIANGTEGLTGTDWSVKGGSSVEVLKDLTPTAVDSFKIRKNTDIWNDFDPQNSPDAYVYTNSSGNYLQNIAAYEQSESFILADGYGGNIPESGIIIRHSDLWVNKYFALSYTAPADGRIRLYDPTGAEITAVQTVNGTNTGTLDQAVNDNGVYPKRGTITVYQNNTVLWSKNLNANSRHFEWPEELQNISVKAGDSISIVIGDVADNPSIILAMNPQIDFYEMDVTEVVDNAATTINAAIEKDKINQTATALSATGWHIKSSIDEIQNLKYYNYYGIGDYKTSSGNGWLNTVAKEGHSGINYGYEYVTAFEDGDFSNLVNNQNIGVNKRGLLFTVGYGGKKYFSLSYTASKRGRITLRDPSDGYIASIYQIESLTTNCLAAVTHTATFAIYKNKEKIWPTNSDYYTFNSSQTYIPFPEINGIYVDEGDTINLVFGRTDVQYALSMALNPQIEYEYTQGDINSDGMIDIVDLVAFKKLLSGDNVKYFSYFDLDNDGGVTSTDFAYMRKYLLGTVDNFNGDLQMDMTELSLKPSNNVTVKTLNNQTEYLYTGTAYTHLTGNPKTEGLNVEKYSQYDVSQLKGAKISKATLHFNQGEVDSGAVNFYLGTNANGNLYIQTVETSEKWNSANFSSLYENSQIKETEWKVRKRMDTSNFYNFNDSELETLDFDITDYLQKRINTNNETLDFKYTYFTDSPFDESFQLFDNRVLLIVEAYIPKTAAQNTHISFTQKGNYKNTVVSSVPTTLENGFSIEGKVTAYTGSIDSPILAVPTMSIYSKRTGEVIKSNVGSGVWLDGTGKTIKNEMSILGLDLNDIVIDLTVSSDGQILFYDKIEPADSIQGVYPKYLYTVTDDSSANRNYSLPIYTDYLYNFDTDIMFSKNGELSDHFDITSANTSEFLNGKNSIEKKIELPLYSQKYRISSKTVIQRATVASKSIQNPIRLLCLGDSVTDGYGSAMTFYQYTQELFYKEALDFNDDSRKIMTLGTNVKGISPKINTFSYNGSEHTLKSFSEGRGGWTLSNFLYHPFSILYKHNFIEAGGSLEGITKPLTYIHSISSIASTANEPDNVFFDNDKEGNTKFSISKWLERYRTHDKDGNKLTLGNGTGSCITAENINSYTVCEPTHILLQFGHNDLRIYPQDQFRKNIWEAVSAIKSELPDAVIIISMTPPSLGTYNEELYPDYSGSTPAGEAWYYNAQYLNDYFEDYDESANNVYLLPTYFVTPTADAYNSSVAAPVLHPNEKAHFNWGYQLYALLKYIG